jgi:hypothetical protein
MTKPTNDRARQRELLSELLISVPCKWNGAMDRDALADKLLDNGVSVELFDTDVPSVSDPTHCTGCACSEVRPSEPEVKPGTTGTATYQGDPGVRVMRLDPWVADSLGAPRRYVWLAWNSLAPWGIETDVTDFIPDVLLPPALGEQIVDWISQNIDSNPDGLQEFRDWWAERFAR